MYLYSRKRFCQRWEGLQVVMAGSDYPTRCTIEDVAPRVHTPSMCYVAIGLMTIPSNCNRRLVARQTWLQHPSVGMTVHARYLIRAAGLPNATQRSLLQEDAAYHDMLFLPVDAHQHVLRGRILVLLAWMHESRSLFPAASWICKGDDDTYVVPPEWEAHLRLLDRGPLRSSCAGHGSECGGARKEAALHGYLVWHNWNTRYYVPHSFSFSYTPGMHWRRAIDYLGGDERAARMKSEQRELESCRKGPLHCQHCTKYDECTGPFPFATGWLFALSWRLAAELTSSQDVQADQERSFSLPGARDKRGGPIFEDVWLGSLLHRYLRHVPITFSTGFKFHFFNGKWDMGRGRDHNTTIVYHNQRMRRVHEHVAATHVHSEPRLQCVHHSEIVSKFTYQYLINWHLYFNHSSRAGSNFCFVVEPRYLLEDGTKQWSLREVEDGLARRVASRTRSCDAAARPSEKAKLAGRAARRCHHRPRIAI